MCFFCMSLRGGVLSLFFLCVVFWLGANCETFMGNFLFLLFYYLNFCGGNCRAREEGVYANVEARCWTLVM